MAKYAYGGRYPDDVIRHWLKTFCRRFFQQQFKRSCIPDGPKVGSVTLSPRGDWRMPSDASGSLWLEEAEKRVEESAAALEAEDGAEEGTAEEGQ